jgi:hypothetical protein
MRRPSCWLTIVVVLIATGRSTEGQTPNTVWYGGTNNQWTENGGFIPNWSSGVPIGSSIVGLGNGDGSVGIGPGGTNLSTGSGAVAGSIVFYQDVLGSPPVTGSYAVGTSGQSLSISSGGSITINANVSASQSFGANITGSGSLTISNNSTAVSNNLSFNGDVSRGTGSINVSSAAGAVRFNGNVTAGSVVLNPGSGEIIFGASGSQNISGGITANGATVSGLAQINNNFTLGTGSVYSPGNGLGSVGSQSIVGDLTFDDGSIFQWDLQDIDTNVYDSLSVSGQLAFGNTSQSVLNLGTNSFDPTQSWTKTIFSGMSSVSGTFGSISLIGADLGVVASQFSWSVSGNNLNLSFSAVPEPSTMVLVGLAGVTGYLIRRKSKSLISTVTGS